MIYIFQDRPDISLLCTRYDLAHAAGWDLYNLHDLAHVSWVSSVLLRFLHILSQRQLRNYAIYCRLWRVQGLKVIYRGSNLTCNRADVERNWAKAGIATASRSPPRAHGSRRSWLCLACDRGSVCGVPVPSRRVLSIVSSTPLAHGRAYKRARNRRRILRVMRYGKVVRVCGAARATRGRRLRTESRSQRPHVLFVVYQVTTKF